MQAGLFNGVMSAINAADRSGYVKRTPDEALVASVLAEFHMVSPCFCNLYSIMCSTIFVL